MGELFTVVSHNERLRVYPLALHKQRQTITAYGCIRHAIVANQRICRYQYLSRIAGVSQTLRIARHRSVEHHFPDNVGVLSPARRPLPVWLGNFFIAKRPAAELRAIAEY